MSFSPTNNSPLPANTDSDVAIQVSKLSKIYQIYERPEDRLKQSLLPRLQRLIGKRPSSYYREFWALKDISFEVRRGETVGIIGRNGAGKSTLLQIICGTLHPSHGIVKVNGRVAALLELGSGFNSEFTGRENVYMNASILGLKRDEIDAKYDDIAAFSGIGDFIDQPVKSYSSGMVLRLAFSVVAHVDADVLVIDEALAVGDTLFQQKCMRFLRKFMEKGSVILVSHDTGAIVNLCQSVIWIEDGIVVENGHPKEVTKCYLESLFQCNHEEKPIDQSVGSNLLENRGDPTRDMRLDFINSTKLRNDIEVFQFSPNASSFGMRGALIKNVELRDIEQNKISWVVGGERVTLLVRCLAMRDISSPIVGFQVNDRLGQIVFGDNTYISYANDPLFIKQGEIVEGRFQFIMPILPQGEYTVSVAIAEGTQKDHVQHHWVHDALVLKSHSSSACTGLVGIPGMDTKLSKKSI